MKRHFFLSRLNLHRPGVDWLTALTGALLVAHGLAEVLGGPENIEETGFYGVFGLSRPGILAGKGWQLVTYSFLHGSWLHLILNGIFIYAIGGRVTRILGGRRSGAIYLGGVLGGGVLHVLLFPAQPLGTGMTPPYPPLVGSSGGMIGLLMAFVSLSPDSRMWPLMISGKNLGRGIMLSALLLFLLTPGVGVPILAAAGDWLVRGEGAGNVFFMVSHPCHLGGGLAGLLSVRRLMGRPVSLDDLRRDRKRREGGTIGS